MHQIHRRFSRWHLTFLSFFGRDLPERVCHGDELTTFVRTPDDVVRSTNRVRFERLMPRRINGRLETSVCRSTTLSPTAVWAICAAHVDPALPKGPACGRGIGPAWCILRETGLYVHCDGVPHPYHANILGWYDEPGAQVKDIKHHWKAAAQRMAAYFPYTARPS